MKILDAYSQNIDSTFAETASVVELIQGIAVNAMEHTWMLLDSSAQSDLPSNYLSQQAVSAIQGMDAKG